MDGVVTIVSLRGWTLIMILNESEAGKQLRAVFDRLESPTVTLTGADGESGTLMTATIPASLTPGLYTVSVADGGVDVVVFQFQKGPVMVPVSDDPAVRMKSLYDDMVNRLEAAHREEISRMRRAHDAELSMTRDMYEHKMRVTESRWEELERSRREILDEAKKALRSEMRSKGGVWEQMLPQMMSNPALLAVAARVLGITPEFAAAMGGGIDG